MAQIWNVSDYSNILPGYQAGLQEWGMRQANERAKLQEERIQRIEEMRQAAERAQEARMAEQYRSTLAQQQAVQRRLEEQFKTELDIDRAYALGVSGLPATPDLDPYGMAAYSRGKAERAADEAKRNPDITVRELVDPATGKPIGRIVPGYGPNWDARSSTPVVVRRKTGDIFSGGEMNEPVGAIDPQTGQWLWRSDGSGTAVQSGTNAPTVLKYNPATRTAR